MDALIYYSLVFSAGALATLISTPIAIRLAAVVGMVDEPDARKVHRTSMPRSGGVAIAIGVLTAAAVAMVAGKGVHPQLAFQVGILIATSLCILAIGVLDDIRNVSAKVKLFVLIVGSLALAGTGARVPLALYGVELMPSDAWGSWPITVLWILAITVSVNFIDGLDGLAGGVVAIAAAALAVGAAAQSMILPALLALALCGSLGGFLVFNFNPARVFMGDSGSMLIGFLLAGISTIAAAGTADSSAVLLTALAMSVPLLDTTLTFIRRSVLQRRSLFSAERGHIHHRLLDLGYSQRHAVLLIYCVSAITAVSGLLLFAGAPVLAVAATLAATLLVARFFHHAGSTRIKETWRAVQLNHAHQRAARSSHYAFEAMQLRLANARCFGDWWHETCAAAARLDFARLELPLTQRDGTPRTLVWSADHEQIVREPVDPDLSKHEARRVAPASPTAPRTIGEDQVLQVSVPVQQRRAGDAPLVIYAEVAANRCLELAGLQITLFLRLMSEHSVRDLPATLDHRTREVLERIPLTPEDPAALDTKPSGGVYARAQLSPGSGSVDV